MPHSLFSLLSWSTTRMHFLPTSEARIDKVFMVSSVLSVNSGAFLFRLGVAGVDTDTTSATNVRRESALSANTGGMQDWRVPR
jgi:hypothetical protein